MRTKTTTWATLNTLCASVKGPAPNACGTGLLENLHRTSIVALVGQCSRPACPRGQSSSSIKPKSWPSWAMNFSSVATARPTRPISRYRSTGPQPSMGESYPPGTEARGFRLHGVPWRRSGIGLPGSVPLCASVGPGSVRAIGSDGIEPVFQLAHLEPTARGFQSVMICDHAALRPHELSVDLASALCVIGCGQQAQLSCHCSAKPRAVHQVRRPISPLATAKADAPVLRRSADQMPAIAPVPSINRCAPRPTSPMLDNPRRSADGACLPQRLQIDSRGT